MNPREETLRDSHDQVNLLGNMFEEAVGEVAGRGKWEMGRGEREARIRTSRRGRSRVAEGDELADSLRSNTSDTTTIKSIN